MLKPKWAYKFAASATMHYDACGPDEWAVLEVPEKLKRWVKPAHYFEMDGVYKFPPRANDELGVVIAAGNSIQETFKALKQNIDALEGQPVSFALDGFFDLLDDIRESEKNGIKFSDSPIPTKEVILKYAV
jgi:hypothetical protein